MKCEKHLVQPIVLPIPPPELRANARIGGHWGPKNDAKKTYQEQVIAALRGYQWGEPEPSKKPVHLRVTVYLGYRQSCDPSDVGAWFKAGLDAMVDFGVFPGDSSKHINPFTAEVRRDASNPRLELTW